MKVDKEEQMGFDDVVGVALRLLRLGVSLAGGFILTWTGRLLIILSMAAAAVAEKGGKSRETVIV